MNLFNKHIKETPKEIEQEFNKVIFRKIEQRSYDQFNVKTFVEWVPGLTSGRYVEMTNGDRKYECRFGDKDVWISNHDLQWPKNDLR
jgi:hypothetical protein